MCIHDAEQAVKVSSVIGARWLQATGFTPNLIYLDSAHEIDETYYELCLHLGIKMYVMCSDELVCW